MLLALGVMLASLSVRAQIIPTTPQPTPRPARKPVPKSTPKPVRKPLSSPNVRTIIQRNYNAMAAAMVKRDVKGALSYVSPDYSQVSPDGETMSLADFRGSLQEIARYMKSFQATTAISKVTVDSAGKKATATVRSTMRVTMKNPETGKDAKFVGIEDSVDTWIKTARGWRLYRSKTRKATQTMDGKPLPQ
jgi:ketosteroid isomerase-like protein